MTENVHIYIYITQIPELCNFHKLDTESSGFFKLVTYNGTTNCNNLTGYHYQTKL
jgi:hypothetical protein